MSIARRSRMHRQSSGKRLELTERDLNIFRALGRYRFLRSTYLHAFAGGASETRFKERLGDLFHEGYLGRPAEQWLFADGRHAPAVHELRDRAQALIAIEEPQQRTWLGNRPQRQFGHALMICEVLASIELAASARDDLRFIPWSEIRSRVPAGHSGTPTIGPAVRPDGLFGIEYRQGCRRLYRFFALEADRGTMPVVRADARQTSLIGKVAAYREGFARQYHKIELGLPNLLLAIVTTCPRRAEHVSAALAPHEAAGLPVLVQAAAAGAGLKRPSPDLLNAPWDRPGETPLRIDEPA